MNNNIRSLDIFSNPYLLKSDTISLYWKNSLLLTSSIKSFKLVIFLIPNILPLINKYNLSLSSIYNNGKQKGFLNNDSDLISDCSIFNFKGVCTEYPLLFNK